MLKKIILLLIISFCGLLGQEGVNKMRVEGKGEFLPYELVDKKYRDDNAYICGAIKITSDLVGLSYTSYNGIVAKVSNPGEDYLYVSPGEGTIEVYKTGYLPLKIILHDYGINLKSGQIWQLTVTGDKKPDKIPVNIIVNPGDARIYINDELQQGGPTFQLAAGSHELRIEKDNYATITETIEVSATSTLFNYTLEPVEQVAALFKSTPKGASIFVNNFDKGVTDKGVFLFPGAYDVKISLRDI